MAAVSSIPAPGAGASSNTNSAQSLNAARTAASVQRAPASLQSDTVKLSLAATIKQMHLQGYTLTVIAAQLGISVKQVDSYLPGVAQTASAMNANPIQPGVKP